MTLFYIDPGTGSYLIQLIIAGVLGVIFFFRNIRKMIGYFFSTLFRKKKNES